MQNLLPAALQVARQFRPASRWRLLGPLLGLLLLGGLGVALSSHLNSRTAAWFTAAAPLPTGRQPNALALADDDGDGDLDLWIAHESGRRLHRYRNDGRGHFVLAGNWPCGNAFGLCLADFNEDGRPDAVVASFRDSLLTWNPSTGPGQWGPTQVLLRGARSFDLWAGDIDGDHHADLLVPNRADSAFVLFGDGRGHFPVRLRLAAGTNALAATAADVDGDGDRDILLTSATNERRGHYVRLYRNQGGRRFVPESDITMSESPQRLTLADMDGDGDNDLLVTAYVSDRVDLCLNDGQGHFGPAQWLPTSRQAFALAVADMNGDGAPDILTTGTLNHSVALLCNQGQGRFAPPLLFDVGKTPSSLAVGDVDGDGQPDVVTVNNADYTATVLRHSRPPLVWWPLAGAGLLGAAYALYYTHPRRRRRERQQRSQLAADLHDELGALLTRVTLRAELLEAEAPAPQLAALIAESRAATATVRDIIWSVNTAPDTIGTLVDRIRDLLGHTQGATAWTTHFTLVPPVLDLSLRLRPDVRQHVYLICKEAITNALRHAQGGQHIQVQLTISRAGLLLHVLNDGAVAAPLRPHDSGQGTHNMQQRARQLGGTLRSAPHPDGGWEVTFQARQVLAG